MIFKFNPLFAAGGLRLLIVSKSGMVPSYVVQPYLLSYYYE